MPGGAPPATRHGDPAWWAQRKEEILEPALEIVDPHHHLWDRDGARRAGMLFGMFDFHTRETPPSSEELARAYKPYLETCIATFGPDRGMFESNFPPDGISSSYAALWNAFKRLAAGYSADDKAKLFRGTATRVYRLA